MVSDRASLEKKIAKELNSFAKKWEGRMIKANPFPQGSYQDVTMAGPHQARAAASTHLAVATKLHDGTACSPALPPGAMTQLVPSATPLLAHSLMTSRGWSEPDFPWQEQVQAQTRTFRSVVRRQQGLQVGFDGCLLASIVLMVLVLPGRLTVALRRPASTRPSCGT